MQINIKILCMQHFNEKTEKLFNATGIAIKKLRQAKGLSLNIFAFENDLQKSLISRLENGQNEAKLSSIWKIAQGLGIKPSELIKEIEVHLPKDFIITED